MITKPLILAGLLTIAMTLYGSVSNRNGRIGVVTGHYTCVISKIEPDSNAVGVLQVGDRIVACDGATGTTKCIDMEGQVAHLEIERKGEILKFDIVRVHFDD